MTQTTASRTALGVALMRAIHTRADPCPLLDDAWGDRLVPQSVKDEILDRALTHPSCEVPTLRIQIGPES